MGTLYVTTSEINDLQKKIMYFANEWARKEKTPISKKELIKHMQSQNENEYGVIYALTVLLRKDYLRRVKVYGDTRTFYKVLRSV